MLPSLPLPRRSRETRAEAAEQKQRGSWQSSIPAQRGKMSLKELTDDGTGPGPSFWLVLIWLPRNLAAIVSPKEGGRERPERAARLALQNRQSLMSIPYIVRARLPGKQFVSIGISLSLTRPWQSSSRCCCCCCRHLRRRAVPRPAPWTSQGAGFLGSSLGSRRDTVLRLPRTWPRRDWRRGATLSPFRATCS